MDIKRALATLGLLTILTLGFQNCGEAGFQPGQLTAQSSQTAEYVDPQKSLGNDYLLSAPLEVSEESLYTDDSDQDINFGEDLEEVPIDPIGNELSDIVLCLQADQAIGEVESIRFRFQGESVNSRSFVWSPSDLESEPPIDFQFTVVTGIGLEVGSLVEMADGHVYAGWPTFTSAGGEQYVSIYLQPLGVLEPHDLVERVGPCLFDTAL